MAASKLHHGSGDQKEISHAGQTIILRGSKQYSIFEVSGSKKPSRIEVLRAETSNIGYLDPWGQDFNRGQHGAGPKLSIRGLFRDDVGPVFKGYSIHTWSFDPVSPRPLNHRCSSSWLHPRDFPHPCSPTNPPILPP